MQGKTEELVYMLLWTCDMLTRPTFRNLTDSFESWAYRQGLQRQLAKLEQQKFLESRPAGGDDPCRFDRVFRLTEAGRLHALGGRDPEARGHRRWDGHWRLVLFDLPNAQSSLRNRLRNQLRCLGFGWLQNSVWISPDPLETEKASLADNRIDVESLIVLQARPCAGESDDEIVAGAWDFKRIKQLYVEHGRILAAHPTGELRGESAARALQKWAAQERLAWLAAVTEDPLLPEALLPLGYRGREAWQKRVAAMKAIVSLVRSFEPKY